MADHIATLEKLKRLPPGVHLLCPRHGQNDKDRYEQIQILNDTKEDSDRAERIAAAETRRKDFIAALQLLAYDGEESAQYQRLIWEWLDSALGNCDLCVREYYVAKFGLRAALQVDYEDEDIDKFFAIIDRRDIERIKQGLAGARSSLSQLPEQKRGILGMQSAHLHAIFEALICEPFLTDEVLLQHHFEEPFRLVQSNRPLRINEYLPAVTRFLFASNALYRDWAVSSWPRISRVPNEYEWSCFIKSTLQNQLQEATNPNTITRLWQGMSIVVDKLEADQIINYLCDLVPNVCTSALNHLSKQTPAVPFILKVMKRILDKAPEAFWLSMDPIPASTVAEQVFASPVFREVLQKNTESSNATTQAVNALAWIPSLLNSLKPENRPPACRVIATQLLDQTRTPSMTPAAKMACYDALVKSLKQTVVNFSNDETARQTVKRIVLSDTLDTISLSIDYILNPSGLGLSGQGGETIRGEVLDLVRNSLALECQCLKADFENLSKADRALPNQAESSSYTPDIWKAVVKNLREDDPNLSSATLLGIMALPGLEQFRTKSPEELSPQKRSYNLIFEKLTGMVSEILEKLAEFKAEHLDELYHAQDTSMSLIATLFSADSRTYQAAIDLVKNLSAQQGRPEALGHLLKAFLSETLYSLCWTFRRISNMKTFASVPRLLKTGMEILDVLCNTQTGILRTKQMAEKDFNSIQTYWSYQWAALNTIFRQTENWSYVIHDKPLMTDVCRDAMQYAEALFEQYDVFVSALTTIKPSRSGDIRKMLLDSSNTKMISPGNTLQPMSKWLRLRDQYLAETLVKLLSKMLHRLGENDAHISSEGIKYIEEVATRNKVKTILTPAHKAQLVRALEAFTKEPIETQAPKKQSSLHHWASATVSRQPGSSTLPKREPGTDEFGDSDITDNDFYELSAKSIDFKSLGHARDVERNKTARLWSEPVKKKHDGTSLLKSVAQKEQESKAFIENRKRETEARKLRDKEAAAKLRGKIGIGEQTNAQGSVINGLGVRGKDHASGQSSMMVSSDSESGSDSSGDEFDRQLFGTKVKSTQDDRLQQAKKMSSTVPTKIIKQQRSQKDIRARLVPDLSTLHKTILAWDFFAETDLPPNSDRTDYSLVTNTFRDAAEYQRTFEPLLILEGWQSFRSAREESNFKPFEIKISNQMIVDSFVEVSTVIAMSDSKDLGVAVSDVVLLSKGQKPTDDFNEPHCLGRVKEVKRKRAEVEIVYRVSAANNGLRSSLHQGARIFGVQILSLTTLEREYGALMALPFYDLCDEIVRAKPSPLLNYLEKDLRQIRQTYEVNEAQAKAVKSALDNDAFTLIQGPPGSGKTKTICALVGAMMTGCLGAEAKFNVRLNGAGNSAARPLPRAAKKVLVCAPSNAAVDELVMRFKSGVRTMNGTSEQLSVVRLGRSDAINANVKDVTLEELVNARLNQAGPKEAKEDIHEVMMEHKATSEKINNLYDQFASTRQSGEQVKTEDEQYLDGLKRKKSQLSEKIDKMRERQNTIARDAELSRKRMQQEVLDSAHVLCATLSGSGHDMFQGLNIEFDTVVIDEAAQSIELSALIPLKYGCSKCILVGDPKQLPPTVLSREAAKFQYEQSLFARMENNHKKDVHLLDTQYRMHPEISLYPSRTFYDSRLKDGPNMAELRARPWHHSKILAPYRFFDVQGMSKTASKGHSLVNWEEINIAMQLYDRLITDVSKYDFTGKIGIITPYKGQLKELKYRFASRYGQDISSAIEFNTTDAFQGRESEIIIFSCVRASTKGIGFLNDIRRMNVGLTRAKCSLWVLGNSEALMQGEFWRAMINDAKARNIYTDGNITQLLSRPLLTEDMMKDDVEMLDADGQAAFATPKVSIATLEDLPSPSSRSRVEAPPIPAGPKHTSLSARLTPIAPAIESDKSQANRQVLVSDPRPMERLHTSESKPSALLRATSDPSAKKDKNTSSSDSSTKDGHLDPSGGRYGLNDLAACEICGSVAHFTHACDNADARAASLGLCSRCKQAGHSRGSCPTPRCLQCGAVGHLKQHCEAPPHQHLNMAEVEMIRKQEVAFDKDKDRNRMKRAEKQRGEHAATIPTVKTSTSPVGFDGKRKRDTDQLVNISRVAKAMKPSVSSSDTGLGNDKAIVPWSNSSSKTSEQGKLSQVASDLANSVSDRPFRPLASAEAHNAGPRRPGLSTGPIKKKKVREDDMFVKKR